MDPEDVVPTHVALTRFPVLAGMLALAGDSWTFRELEDDNGLTALYGMREYPGFGQLDAIKIKSETDARAQRTMAGAGILKQYEGGLGDAVYFLRNLPHPASPFAPNLIIATAPKTLWTPN